MNYEEIERCLTQLTLIYGKVDEAVDDERIARSDHEQDEAELGTHSQNIEILGNAKLHIFNAISELNKLK